MRATNARCSRHTAAAVITPSLGSLLVQPSQLYPGSHPDNMKNVYPLQCAVPNIIRPPPMRGSFIDRNPTWASFNENHAVKSFRRRIVASTDISHWPLQFHLAEETKPVNGVVLEQKHHTGMVGTVGYGEQLDEISARWAAKFYGQVTFGPRNYPYPSSRWLARRFKMKKHKIIKRFRFRRYKLAAVANLPFAKMIRVGMLPELKSSKTKKGDVVDASLTGQLVSAVRNSGGKQKGLRGRPKSKYQV